MSKRFKPLQLNNIEIGYVKPREIAEEMRESYIDYAMSVIVSRALPDVRDGLKPVHRRILYTMWEDGLTHNAKFRKSASVIGSTLSRYHPHGDMAVYDALVRMAQDFSLRYPLITPQGNFGSIDGDSAAAYRYTEAKLSRIGEEMLRDIEKNTVDFRDNYDGTRKEPVYLPSPLPQLILNGSLGIAVGMATNIPPHNLSEVMDALIYFVDHPNATTQDLFKFIQGPDFPTGGIVYDRQGIIEAYSQGKGSIVMRGKAEIVEQKGGRHQIVITEIPYQVLKSSLIEQFANLVQEKKIEGIKDIRDESDKEGLRIVIELSSGAFPQKVLNRLYKFSDLQKTFHLNMLALVDGIQPKVLSLSELFGYYIQHRKEVIIRRTRYELQKAKEREHILEGLHKCLAKIDEVIRLIKRSDSREDAKNNLMKRFKLTEIQANAILDTRLSQLAKLERQKIEEELKQIRAKIKELTEILKSEAKVKEVMKKEFKELKEGLGDERKTIVYAQKIGEIAEEDLVPQEETLVVITRGGYIKRVSPKMYRQQERGGKGIIGMKTIGEDIVEHFFAAMTHDFLLFFTDSGKVFRCPTYEIPEGTRVSKGRALVNFLEISSQERVLSVMPYSKEDKTTKFIIMVTKNGIIKKTPIEDFDNIRRSGLIAINLKKGDELRGVAKSSGEDEIILVTKNGQGIRFLEKELKPIGRTASGVQGIRLRNGDEVVGMDVVSRVKKNKEEPKEYLLVLTENGYGKRSALKEHRIQKRGGSGIKVAQITKKIGQIIASKVLSDQEDLIVISQKGNVIRVKISAIPKRSRATQGVKIMRLESGDKIASATYI